MFENGKSHVKARKLDCPNDSRGREGEAVWSFIIGEREEGGKKTCWNLD